MDLQPILLLATAFVIVLNIVTYIRLTKNKSNDPDTLANHLTQKLNQIQMELIAQVLTRLATNSAEIRSEITQIRQELVEHLTSKTLEQSLSLQTSLQQITEKFGLIQVETQQGLASLKESVSLKLEASITNLLNNNQQQLQQLQESNRLAIDTLNKVNQTKLDQINLDIQKRLDENFAQNLRSVQEVSQKLGQMEQTAVKIIDSTKSVDKLNDIFSRTSSKSFGGFAESYLETLLEEHLSSGVWQKQVKVVGSSDIIDFRIEIGNKKIGIDSKFPLTRYQDYLDAAPEDRTARLKDYLKAIEIMAKDISSKYYRNGFVDTLLLYLPSDSMYLEAINNQQLSESLAKLKVSCISPNSILPMLTLINSYHLKQQVTEQAEFIISGIKKIRDNVAAFQDEFRKLGEKLRLAQDNYDKAERNILSVQRTVVSTLEYKPDIEAATTSLL